MFSLRAMAMIGLLLAALAAPIAPALAHPVTPIAPEPDLMTTTANVVVASAPAAAESRVPEPAAVPIWGIAAALGLAALLARRTPRQAMMLALVLLLTTFAFENALHSVHHGFDASQSDECTIAAASAHLSAVSVDGVVEVSAILAVGGPTAEAMPQLRPSRFLGPDQGRAPPAPAV